MNRYQHDNIDPDVTPEKRKAVLEQKRGIGHNRRNKNRKAENNATKGSKK